MRAFSSLSVRESPLVAASVRAYVSLPCLEPLQKRQIRPRARLAAPRRLHANRV